MQHVINIIYIHALLDNKLLGNICHLSFQMSCTATCSSENQFFVMSQRAETHVDGAFVFCVSFQDPLDTSKVRSSSRPLDGNLAIPFESLSDHIEFKFNLLRENISKRPSDDFLSILLTFPVSKYQISNSIIVVH